MPKLNPLIIFENHLAVGGRAFIAKNVRALKEMGYTKFLLEMNKECSHEQCKKQLRDILSQSEVAISMRLSCQALLDMLLALEKHNIPYEFIDPETQAKAHQINMKLQSAAMLGDASSVIAERQRMVKHRDEEMSVDIIADAKIHLGGVIFLGGFAHTHLIKKLEADRKDYYRFAIFTDSTQDQSLAMPRESAWANIPHAAFRAQYYQAEVKFFDLASHLSFEMIEAICQLTTRHSCDTSIIGEYLHQATRQSYNIVNDSHHVVTAIASGEEKQLEETVGRIKKYFPKLQFFVDGKGANTHLTIPGINLPENRDILKDGFVKLGVMKP